MKYFFSIQKAFMLYTSDQWMTLEEIPQDRIFPFKDLFSLKKKKKKTTRGKIM